MHWLCPAPVAEKDLEGQGAAQYGSKGALLDPQVWPGLNTQFPAVPRPGGAQPWVLLPRDTNAAHAAVGSVSVGRMRREWGGQVPAGDHELMRCVFPIL